MTPDNNHMDIGMNETGSERPSQPGGAQDHSRLVPILREGVGVVRLVFFRALREDLSTRYAHREPVFVLRLAGALLNELFGMVNPEETFVRFMRDNEALIQEEMKRLSDRHEGLRPSLTDALRVQFLCDSHDGAGDESVLTRALDLGILIEDREVPLPRNFLAYVRSLGSSAGLLAPVSVQEEAHEA